ncbi:MAG: succinylglutamate desuccinylase [Enterobacterales bacterium]|jgi:succinylglutamate desuccinylase
MNILNNELLEHFSFLKLTQENPMNLSTVLKVKHNNCLISLLDTGVLQIEPAIASSTDIVISSGIHGNETAPIEICDQLVKDILTGTLAVKNRLLFIIGNPPAMNSGKRFLDENLNRLFCEKHLGKKHPEAERAGLLEKYVRDFYLASDTQTTEAQTSMSTRERCHFDLHTAIRTSKYEKFAIYPYQDGRGWNKRYLNFFKESDINTVLLAHQPAGTFSYFSSHEFQANAFTVELGQVKPFGENDMDSFSSLMVNLKSLINDQYIACEKFDSNGFNLFKVDDEVIRQSELDFSLNIDSSLSNFTEFPLGFQLTTDDNGGYKFASEGQAIVFPNAKVPPGQRVALIVSKTSI